MMFIYRIDDDTYLKLLGEENTSELYALIEGNRTYLARWLPWVDKMTDYQDVSRYILGTLQQFSDNNGFFACIWHKRMLVGVVGFHFFDWRNSRTALGYWLDEKHQGIGLMRKACIALVDYAVKELSINRIEIRCASFNTKSMSLAEGLGFTHEGVLRKVEKLGENWVDHVVYSVLSEEWHIEIDKPT